MSHNGEYDIVSPESIDDGTATDAYFLRTEEALDHAEKNPRVVAEVTQAQFPHNEYSVFAGVKDAAHLLEGLPIDVYALEEGRLFSGGPVLRIEGNYRDFARYETSLLGFLGHASGVATKALDTRLAAPDTTILSFGARHVHPSITPMIERSALIAGLDGFSHVAAGEVLEREASGTMPHALVISFGDGNQADAFEAFDGGVHEDVPRIPLCDTYDDETTEVRRALDTLGDDLDGVRLDTTSSRRGDFKHIIKEVQWELQARGHDEVPIYVSGGLGPAELRDLRDLVAGFGVGGYISKADPLDFGLDIIEIDGNPCAKRGKLSGQKEVYRTDDGEHVMMPENADVEGEKLLKPLILDGEIVIDFNIDKATARTMDDVEALGLIEQAEEKTAIPADD